MDEVEPHIAAVVASLADAQFPDDALARQFAVAQGLKTYGYEQQVPCASHHPC